ncbi:hypothetical protein BDN72DRAFT_962952 [Pluteus cervinus]|uniref:Uncharacterized protein n=1 Tax=Pluteus cervinus TaxID=181527 RepID=A0ACD3AGF9_9AGAR|nr:hypothetical protein BDN72DRAFT_962952 [Pluteus cervinus]
MLWPEEFQELVNTWPHLPSAHPLSRFHAKFWGISLELERAEWRAAHAARLSSMGPDWSGTHEIKSTCYVLDIGFSELGVDKLWVRADYNHAYQCMKEHCPGTTERVLRSPSAVLTGSPGVGKTYFMIYALRRRIGEQEITLLYRDNTLYLFWEGGVHEVPRIPPQGFSYYKPWLLINSDEAPKGVPPELLDQDTPYFVVYCASPPETRWLSMSKGTNPGRFVLNPWTKEEIHEVAAIRFENPDLGAIDAVYDNYGPTPRLCIDYVADKAKLEEYKTSLDALISTLSFEIVLSMVRSVQALRPIDGAEKLFIIRRIGSSFSDLHSYKCDVTTRSLQSEIAVRMRKGTPT